MIKGLDNAPFLSQDCLEPLLENDGTQSVES